MILPLLKIKSLKTFSYICTILTKLSTTNPVKIYLFDSIESHNNLLPLSFTRPVADFRCGILTIREKWEHYLPGDYDYYPVDYLRDKYGSDINPEEESIFIAGNLLPNLDLIKEIRSLEAGEELKKNEKRLAFRGRLDQFTSNDGRSIEFEGNVDIIEYVFDIFLKNEIQIKYDFALITEGRSSAPLPECVRTITSHKGRLFLEEGAVVECATINTNEGPVYVGKDAILMEGACVRGPFALCEGAEVRMGAKIYEGTTIGPHCKVGGEISNTVFFGYSNKAHDGYLGNAVIGEWCNIGAGTNASNLKNDYSLIRVWNYASRSFMKTDLQFCGLIMGDHSKIGVNCMINTATVVGVGVNIHGAGFPRAFVPCFCEGSPVTGFSQVPLKKFLDTAERVMSRRDKSLSASDITLLSHIYSESQS